LKKSPKKIKAIKDQKGKSPKSPLRVVELFAGVGGFRLGLEAVAKGKAFKVIWSNQYEPGSAKQWASRVYEHAFRNNKGSIHSNKLIEEAIAAGEVPKHNVLVGGFPCQDYSVAKPNNQSRGIEGKKGVLWWSIYQIAEKHEPDYLILENVDRLIKSPAKQRGRDFAIMLKCLAMLGYIVEWRVINAAEYGMPQRRRRVFIVGYKPNSALGKEIKKTTAEKVLLEKGILAEAFPVQTIKPRKQLADDDSDSEEEVATDVQLELFAQLEWRADYNIISKEPHELTDSFNKSNAQHDPFKSAGLMIPTKDGKAEVWTAKVYPKFTDKSINLGDLLTDEKEVPEEFYIDSASLKSWVYQKGNKSEVRTNYLTTFDHIKKLFTKADINCELTNTQKRSWGKKLDAYWKENPTPEKPLKLNAEGNEKTIDVTRQLIADTRFEYSFKEGPLPMPDPLDRPLRTIITSEGGTSPSRFKHVICCACAASWKKKGKPLNHDCVKAGKFRRLTPVELELGNMFPPEHTKHAILDGKKVEIDPKHRAFFMGNALVVGAIEKIGKSLVKKII
jgi:DNA (cytosine-5)-methyltransferase 1